MSAAADSKRRNMALLAAAIVLVLSVWFAGTVAVPSLIAQGLVTPGRAAWLTACVQLGFVAGTLVSAVLSLADRADPRRLFLGCAVLAAAATLGQTLVAPAGGAALALRFLAGAAMAGVYPVGMKLAASWAKGDLGLLIGIVVGAVTLGSALPHLLPGLTGSVDWRGCWRCWVGCWCCRSGPGRCWARGHRSGRRRCWRRSATAGCGSPMSATSATCGNSMPCGPGSGCS
jgi:hypothetical protein